eukprot:Awhi_evm1s762
MSAKRPRLESESEEDVEITYSSDESASEGNGFMIESDQKLEEFRIEIGTVANYHVNST